MTKAQKLASLGTLSASLVHKLTQPLSAVQLSIQNALACLDKEHSPERLRRLLDHALSAVRVATDVVTNVRGLARNSATRQPTEVSFAVIAGNVVRLLMDSNRQARIKVCVEGLDLLPNVLCDERDVEQVFFILTENAVQASRGKRGCRLVIRGALKDKHIELRFCDDCGGIRPEHMDSLFEPFFTTKPLGEGTGLGLPIVRDILARVGGSIRVETQYGVGTTFFVTWPLGEGRAGE